MDSAQIPNEQVSGNVLLYGQPEPLSFEKHGTLGLVRAEHPFTFVASAPAVPLQVAEFGPASMTYPIIFGGEGSLPLALMSIRKDENLFVTDQGEFVEDAYIPAFIRRWPFVLANSEDQQQLIVCIDRDASVIAEGGEVRLFEEGKPSEFTQQAIKFCTDFEADRRRTEQFVETLKSLDLLETKQTTFTPQPAHGKVAEPIQLAEYLAVSDEKLAALPRDKVFELHSSGALRQIYAHLASMMNWDRLIARATARGPLLPA